MSSLLRGHLQPLLPLSPFRCGRGVVWVERGGREGVELRVRGFGVPQGDVAVPPSGSPKSPRVLSSTLIFELLP